MRSRTALLSAFGITVCLIGASLTQAAAVWPLLTQADVRAATPAAMEQLRAQGYWLVDVTLTGIERRDAQICFEWTHTYHGGTLTGQSTSLVTCVPNI